MVAHDPPGVGERCGPHGRCHPPAAPPAHPTGGPRRSRRSWSRRDGRRLRDRGGATVSAPSSQVTSAGRISVATCPGGPMAAATAAAASSPTVAGSVEEWTQPDTPLAIAAMSDCSGASYLRVVRRVVADDVDDRRPGTAGVVQVGQPVAEARSEVEQHPSGATGDAGVAVGGAGRDALEQGEDRRASRERRRARRRSASPTCRGSRSRRRPRSRRACG